MALLLMGAKKATGFGSLFLGGVICAVKRKIFIFVFVFSVFGRVIPKRRYYVDRAHTRSANHDVRRGNLVMVSKRTKQGLTGPMPGLLVGLCKVCESLC